MGRMVTAPIVSISIGTGSAGDDIFELTAGSANKIKLHGFAIYSNQVSAEAITLRLLRRTTAGSGGSAATEVKRDQDDGTITGALVANNTTAGTPGDVLEHYEWEQLGPLQMIYTPAMMPIIEEGGRLCLETVDATGATQTWQGWVTWEEI